MIGRILSVTSNFPRWTNDSTTPFVLHLAEDLCKLGWEVTVLAPHAPNCALQETMNGVRVERFRYLWPDSLETVCYQGGALINLRRNRLNYLKVPALVTSELLKIISRLQTRAFDLLHTHWLIPQGFTGALVSSFLKTPHVTTVHGGDIFSLNGKILNSFKRFALQKADYTTVNSSVTLKAVREILPEIQNTKIIPMGISVPTSETQEKGKIIRKQWCFNNGPLIVYVGRLVTEKGVDDLIDAVPLLLKEIPQIRVLIIGDGQEKMHFQNKINKLGLKINIIIIGWQAPEDVPAYLSAADVFVGPSRIGKGGWQEAQGLTFAESMIVNTPVIATNTGGIQDFVKHEITGLIVDQQSPDQIAQAVKKVLFTPKLKETIIRKGFQLSMRHTRKVVSEAFSNLFLELLINSKQKG